ncbi:MAG: SRPBCC family protein [Alphaproteobacteria bacterium]|nr:SRPBCC family protein [Alphaproteobacteria bacterium]
MYRWSYLNMALLSMSAGAALFTYAPHASAAPAVSIVRSVDVDAPASAVWSKIGGFCAIANWHPMIARCEEDGKTPSTRTLVGKDGKTRFVETQVSRSDGELFYSYAFVASPIPARGYFATIRVVPRNEGGSTVIWNGSYVPAPGKQREIEDALTGIYESGLSAIRAKFLK